MNFKDTPFIDIHTHCHCEAFGLAMTWPTYGIHPWWFDEAGYDANRDLETLMRMLQENRLAAIGEVGVDKAHKATVALQIKAFEQQILLSEQYQKPLIIHNVRGTDEILRLHKKHHPQQAWIIHGFNGTASEAQQLINKGVFLSVGEGLFHENRKIHESISSIPLDRLFLETDTSEKTIQEIYEKAAELINLPIAALKERIFANFAQLKIEVWNNGTTEQGCSSATVALRNLGTAMC